MPMMTSNGASALQRMSLRDMLVVPETTELFLSNLTQHAAQDPAGVAALEIACFENLAMAYGYEPDRGDDRKPFVYNDGVAVIPIHGTLINRFNSSWGFVTGYNFIRRQMNAALDDDDVTLIIFDVDSPGGEASGCFELAREIMASRRVKPSLAMVDSLAASGGMALAGSATTMYAIPSARIGSIGVYRMHVSYEAAMKNDGIKITFATAGEHKIDGNPYQDLPQAVLDQWTQEAGKTWDDFISLVAEARDMPEAEVKATQARVYRADEALAKGLINAVKTPTEAVAAFLAELAGDTPSNDEEDDDMADAPKGKEVTSGDLSPGALEAIKSIVGTMLAPVLSAGRVNAITALGASQGKPKLAAELAADVSITLEQATKLLNVAAVEGKTKPASKGKAKVGTADDDDGEDGDADEDGEDGEDEDEDDDDDEDGENAADIARAKRKSKAKVKGGGKGDNVNHLDNAMGKSGGGGNVGGGGAGDGGAADKDDPDAQAAAILGDHHRVAGAGWSDMKRAKKSKAA